MYVDLDLNVLMTLEGKLLRVILLHVITHVGKRITVETPNNPMKKLAAVWKKAGVVICEDFVIFRQKILVLSNRPSCDEFIWRIFRG